MSAIVTDVYIIFEDDKIIPKKQAIIGAFGFSAPIVKDGFKFYALYTELDFDTRSYVKNFMRAVSQAQKDALIRQYRVQAHLQHQEYIVPIIPLNPKEYAAFEKISRQDVDNIFNPATQEIFRTPLEYSNTHSRGLQI